MSDNTEFGGRDLMQADAAEVKRLTAENVISSANESSSGKKTDTVSEQTSSRNNLSL